LNAIYIFLLRTRALEIGLVSFLERTGIVAVRRVRIPYRILDSPGVLGLSAFSSSSIGLISSVCLYSRAIEIVRTRSSGCSLVRLRLVDYLAFAKPIATIIPPIAYSLV